MSDDPLFWTIVQRRRAVAQGARPAQIVPGVVRAFRSELREREKRRRLRRLPRWMATAIGSSAMLVSTAMSMLKRFGASKDRPTP